MALYHEVKYMHMVSVDVHAETKGLFAAQSSLHAYTLRASPQYTLSANGLKYHMITEKHRHMDYLFR